MIRSLIVGTIGIVLIVTVIWLASGNNPAASQSQNLAAASPTGGAAASATGGPVAFTTGMGGAESCSGMMAYMSSTQPAGGMNNTSGMGSVINMSSIPAAEARFAGNDPSLQAHDPVAAALNQKIEELSTKIQSLAKSLDQIATESTRLSPTP